MGTREYNFADFPLQTVRHLAPQHGVRIASRDHRYKQVALLWQRDRATRLSVEILQLQNIPFKN